MSSTVPINSATRYDGYGRVSFVGERKGQDSYKSPESNAPRSKHKRRLADSDSAGRH